MTPDDARHGTYAGYNARCREMCCRRAAADYQRQRYFDHEVLGLPPRRVNKIGTLRRVQALQRLGWSGEDLSRQIGHTRAYLNVVLNHPNSDDILNSTAEKVRGLYERLSMMPGPSHITRLRAARSGWAPPLAWDDETIDNPDATPSFGGRDDGLDPVVVMRLLEGRRIEANRAEREEAIRRWVEDGGTKTELCNIHGWAPDRYQVRTRLTLVRGGAA